MIEKVLVVMFTLIWIGVSAILALSLSSDLENFAEFPKLYSAWFGFSFLTILLVIIRKLKSKLH